MCFINKAILSFLLEKYCYKHVSNAACTLNSRFAPPSESINLALKVSKRSWQAYVCLRIVTLMIPANIIEYGFGIGQCGQVSSLLTLRKT